MYTPAPGMQPADVVSINQEKVLTNSITYNK